jgi:hypothetical protein
LAAKIRNNVVKNKICETSSLFGNAAHWREHSVGNTDMPGGEGGILSANLYT